MANKKAKPQNAMKHGAFSQEMMLPGEKKSDYEVTRASVYDEWTPDGATEEYLVERLVELFWRKQRLGRYTRIIMQSKRDEIREDNRKGDALHHLRNLAPEFAQAAGVDQVNEVLSTLSPAFFDFITKNVPQESCEDPAEWGPTIGRYLSRLEPQDRTGEAMEFLEVVDPDLIDMELARSERIDAAIDRTIKRLMQVKTAKQVFPGMRKKATVEANLISVAANDVPLRPTEKVESKQEADEKEATQSKQIWRPGPGSYTSDDGILRIR